MEIENVACCSSNEIKKRDLVRIYLMKHEQDEFCLKISHANVIQRSYGCEKRYLSPPPYITLDSYAWTKWNFLHHNAKNMILSSINVTNSSINLPLTFDSKLSGLVKQLFVTDKDKFKSFSFNVTLVNAERAEHIGTFESKPIKIMSKPSKKKRPVRNAQSCFKSDNKIAIFNRSRVVSIGTKFLHVNNNILVGNDKEWSPFRIILVDNNENCGQENKQRNSDVITYGSVIRLVCLNTNVHLPDLIVRKVEKTNVILDSDDPVCHLHKCAFHLKDSNRMYLCIEQNQIKQFQASKYPNENNKEIVNEKCLWTITSVDHTEYRWCSLTKCNLEKPAVINGLAPILNKIKEFNNGEEILYEFSGSYFSDSLEVWFNDIKLDLHYKSNDKILAAKTLDCSNLDYSKIEILFIQDDMVFNKGYLKDHDVTVIIL